MRILAVDAGNSRIKWGLHEHGSWQVQSLVATDRAPSLARAWRGLERPDVVLAANVAGPSVAADLTRAAAGVLRRPIRFTRSAASQCGVSNSYDKPGQLGPDRWAALIGARHLHRCACVVVNAGTTMTVDALTAEGIFLGGTIVPGLELMREALARNTARLKPRRGRFAYFPARTADAIESGSLNALAGAIERVVGYTRRAARSTPLIVLSGGAAQRLRPHLNGAVEVVDNLVLEGLACMALDGAGGR